MFTSIQLSYSLTVMTQETVKLLLYLFKTTETRCKFAL